MFGFKHRTAHLCSVGLDETDRQPPHLCPVGLNKLHDVIGFDVGERDTRLSNVLREAGLLEQAQWYEKRRAWLGAPAIEPAR